MTQRAQIDLLLDSLINAPLKDDRALMEFPFFSLEKRPRMEPLVYDDGKVRIEVKPGSSGLATIWDKDLLIFVASIINDRLERGLAVSRTVAFSARELTTLIGRGTGAKVNRQIQDALLRLRSTTIVTTIKSGDEQEDRGFGWIESWRVVRREGKGGKKIMAALEVTLND
jgi:plasmid replication initiation protein